jgi:hypothetical protein
MVSYYSPNNSTGIKQRTTIMPGGECEKTVEGYIICNNIQNNKLTIKINKNFIIILAYLHKRFIKNLL